MNKINASYPSIEQITNQYLKTGINQEVNTLTSKSFEEVLQDKQSQINASGLKFSKHATMRLNNRNIQLTQEQNDRLENGVEIANEKGIKDSLVIVDSLAFIVNVPNRTVVTAMEKTEQEETFFTNIDGAVIV